MKKYNVQSSSRRHSHPLVPPTLDSKPIQTRSGDLMFQQQNFNNNQIKNQNKYGKANRSVAPIPSDVPQALLEKEKFNLSLYKTELCRVWEESGECKFGDGCLFAHGREELRQVPRHPKYKTEICRAFHTHGTCAYGARCRFIHDYSETRAAWAGDWQQWETELGKSLAQNSSDAFAQQQRQNQFYANQYYSSYPMDNFDNNNNDDGDDGDDEYLHVEYVEPVAPGSMNSVSLGDDFLTTPILNLVDSLPNDEEKNSEALSQIFATMNISAPVSFSKSHRRVPSYEEEVAVSPDEPIVNRSEGESRRLSFFTALVPTN